MIFGVLFFIPFVGQAAGAAGLTAVRSLIRLVGGAGEVALGVYSIVQDPENAFGAGRLWISYRFQCRPHVLSQQGCRKAPKHSEQ